MALQLNRTYNVRNHPVKHLNGRRVVLVGFDAAKLHGKPVQLPAVYDEGDVDCVIYYMEPQFLFEV